ncbi:MAG: saccharopine dehydrogenase NADP-binding domain-containing protein [Candidatus Eremiobacteraeota bacterium]|nr:saccharopine dehydrogenase NADP-binding domain-containing protein [Candidatus Eremiobacteraeota bacterium]
MRILILGSGMMGNAAAFFLSGKKQIDEIILADRDLERPESIAREYNSKKIKPVAFDAKDSVRIRELMENCQVAIGATSYEHNLLYTDIAIDSGCSFIDLGGNHDVVDQQFARTDEAKKAGVTIIPDCGLAPGFVNILSAKAIDELDETDSIQIRVGGVPIDPLPPLNYCLLFNARGLINEYIEKSRIIKDGKITIVDSMDGLETIHFPDPFGEMEAFFTSGGISTLTKTLRDNVKNLDYKTIRYPGHQKYIKFLIEMGFTGSDPIDYEGGKIVPRNVLERILENNLKSNASDAILLRVTATGTDIGFKTIFTQEVIDFYDVENHLTSMMRMTAFPCAIIALMIANGDISKKGVLCQEKSIPLDIFFKNLEDANIRISNRKQRIE